MFTLNLLFFCRLMMSCNCATPIVPRPIDSFLPSFSQEVQNSACLNGLLAFFLRYWQQKDSSRCFNGYRLISICLIGQHKLLPLTCSNPFLDFSTTLSVLEYILGNLDQQVTLLELVQSETSEKEEWRSQRGMFSTRWLGRENSTFEQQFSYYFISSSIKTLYSLQSRQTEEQRIDKERKIINMKGVLGIIVVIIGVVRAEFQAERFEKAGEVGWPFAGPSRDDNVEIESMYREECLLSLKYLPFPTKLQCGNETLSIPFPCEISFIVHARPSQHLKEIINHQMLKTFQCKTAIIDFIDSGIQPKQSFFLQIISQSFELKSAFTTEQEQYQLTISTKNARLKAKTYVGIVRGIETFIQSLICGHSSKDCSITYLPQIIEDLPAYQYRGLMIDSSRHFLPVPLIYETIDAMMYNKLNILQWHIVDQDSFPLLLDSHPEISEYASFSKEQTYSSRQARDIVRYAMIRGVRVIPELTTPGRTASWTLAPQNKDIACPSNGSRGHFDVTLSKTYELMTEVFAEIFDIFPDPFVHLGGNEVILTCFQNKTDFTLAERITQFDIQQQYRIKQRKLLKELAPQKQFIYWANQQKYKVKKGDTLQWWGSTMPTTIEDNNIILSLQTVFNLDIGFGGFSGRNDGDYQTWLHLYQNNIRDILKDYDRNNVIGAVVCLWSEVSNKYVHHTKIWIRTSSFAEKMWNTAKFKAQPDFLRRLTHFQKLMNQRGIATSAATSQKCEQMAQYCS